MDRLNLKKIRRLVFCVLFPCAFLISSLSAAQVPCVWTGVEKIVAVGDLHGDYDNFVKILKGTDLVNRELHWTAGKTHLVQMGDIMDKGPDAKKILDLMMTLEMEAEKAGGKVHCLIGNHEEVNISGIAFDYPGYVTLEQFVAFLPDKYREKKEIAFRRKAAKESPPGSVSLITSVPRLSKYWEEAWNDPQAREEYFKSFNAKYGKWILRNNAVISINDIIFVHGGISERFSKWKIEDINATLRRELDLLRLILTSSMTPPSDLNLQIAYQSDGPLWHRELAMEDEKTYQQDVDRLLSSLGVNHMVIAHTPQVIHSKADMNRFQGKIWIIDTGISRIYPGGHQAALIIENGNFSVWGVPNGEESPSSVDFFDPVLLKSLVFGLLPS